jgi:hypothetical protein
MVPVAMHAGLREARVRPWAYLGPWGVHTGNRYSTGTQGSACTAGATAVEGDFGRLERAPETDRRRPGRTALRVEAREGGGVAMCTWGALLQRLPCVCMQGPSTRAGGGAAPTAADRQPGGRASSGLDAASIGTRARGRAWCWARGQAWC